MEFHPPPSLRTADSGFRSIYHLLSYWDQAAISSRSTKLSGLTSSHKHAPVDSVAACRVRLILRCSGDLIHVAAAAALHAALPPMKKMTMVMGNALG